MPDIKEHIEYLSQEIGPHPSGTEEEQKAALYITEQFQKEAGLPAAIEDIGGIVDPEIPRMIYGGIALLFALLGLIVPGLGAVWFVGALIGAGLLVADILGHPLLATALGKGVSQNVVAKYEPGSDQDGPTRKRKVVVIAHYDTGKVRQELAPPIVQFMPIVNKAVVIAIIAMPVLLLIKNLLGASGGFLASFFTLLVIVALILSAIPVALGALHRSAAYSEGANSNSSGVAALMEVASRVGRGRMSEADLVEYEEARMHGEQEAVEAGLVPEGAEFVYSTGSEDDLNAAKAAIAALSGKPVSGMTPEDVERNLDMLNARAEEEAQRAQAAEENRAHAYDASTAEEAEGEAPDEALPYEQGGNVIEPDAGLEPESEPIEALEHNETQGAPAEPEPKQESAVPDWFKKAQEKAKKSTKREKPAQRSQYAAAFEAVEAEGSEMFAQAAADAEREVQAASRAAQTAEAERATVYEVHAPQWNTNDADLPLEETQHGQLVSGGSNASLQGDAIAQQHGQDASSSEETAVMAPIGVSEDAFVDGDGTVADLSAAENISNDAAEAAKATEAAGARGKEGNPDPLQQLQPHQTQIQAESLHTGISQHAEAPSGAEQPDESVKSSVPAVPVSADPSATMAAPPIDVSQFRLDAEPVTPSIPMPSFLDPRKVQAEKLANNSAAQRTGNRVDATDARITSLGVVDQQTLVAENPTAQEEEQAAAAEAVPAIPFSANPVNGGQPGSSKQAATKRPILLPNIATTGERQQPVIAKAKQRAPLADVETAGKTAAKSLLSTLPTIGSADVAAEGSSADKPAEDAVKAGGARGKNASLLVSLPSLSGAIKAADSAQEQASTAAQSSLGTAGATGAFAPVTDELVRNASLDDDSDELYVDDVDDSEYDTDFTQTGAIAGPGYVEMPKSRFRRFLDKFHHDKAEDETSAQDWLDVDDQFEARAVGRARGGWESFQDESYGQGGYGADYGADDAYEGDSFHGLDAEPREEAFAGATQAFPPYSQLDQADYQGFNAHVNEPADAQGDFLYVDDAQEMTQGKLPNRQWHGGSFSLRRMENGDLKSEEVSAVAAASAENDAVIDEELEQIYKFRNPEIKTEVWFVALGSELSGNAGIKAFLAEHEHELKGAFIVEVDSLGGGDLTLIDAEGELKPSKPSSRMKRYLRKASQTTGIKLASAPLLWQESAASYATKHGYQAVHLVGMTGGKPAGYAEASDTVEGVDMRKVEKNANYIMELLKNI